ncbi:TonB-denpendent receptor [Thiomicrospira aerophila AL3]|uniref:TonB-denpendent receptor n=1 Tax=Thiomicrospira aerophila AL3 TaxID=717772 RepID=W0DTX5_9GAMM|nr:TonB-dependent receptor [Thiomicrospira aerophila]AHF00698.1 TonB-denpendent receptor [Thiomicrospira aerophila AL3]
MVTKHRLKKWLFGLGLTGSLAGTASSSWALDEAAALAEWQAFLNQQTELVTRTKLNADFVPGSITVLHGETLVRYGAKTLADALALAPNIDMQINLLGQRVIVMRGVGAAFSNSSVKVMLDGVNTVHASQGFAQTLLHMPVEQIERIEIIRGAATVVHGEDAIAGVVNIITRDTPHAHLAVGSNGYRGASISQGSDLGSGRVRINLSAWGHQATGVRAESDAVTVFSDAVNERFGSSFGFEQYSAAPGRVNNQRAFEQLQLGWQTDQTQLSFAYNRLRTGDFYGVIEFLPPSDERYAQTYEDYLISLNHEQALTNNLRSVTQLSLSQLSYELDTLYVPNLIPGSVVNNLQQGVLSFCSSQPEPMNCINEETSRLSFLPGFLEQQSYINQVREQQVQLQQQFIYDLNSAHRLLFGVDVRWVEITHAAAEGIQNLPSNDHENVKTRFGSTGDSRHTLALFLQDEWRISEDFTLTAGIRWQQQWVNYTDRSKDNQKLADPWQDLEVAKVTPKLAAVWQVAPKHILKAQFSQSHVTPPINQVTDVGNLKPGEVRPEAAQSDHYELGYVYAGYVQTHRITFYHSEFAQLAAGTHYYHYFRPLNASEFGQTDYAGLRQIRAKGVEWDADFRLGFRWRGFTNLSINQTDDLSGNAVVGSRPYLGRLGLDYKFNDALHLAGSVSYAAPLALEPYDDRDDLPSYWLWNAAANYMLPVRGWRARLTVNNLTNVQVASPSPINVSLSQLAGKPTAPYANGYLHEGRSITLSLDYQF